MTKFLATSVVQCHQVEFFLLIHRLIYIIQHLNRFQISFLFIKKSVHGSVHFINIHSVQIKTFNALSINAFSFISTN